MIVAEKRSGMRGRSVEDLGWHNPLLKKTEIEKERVSHWLKVGAKPTDTVHNLLVSNGVIQAKKIPVHKKPKGKKEETGRAAPASAEKPKEQEATA